MPVFKTFHVEINRQSSKKDKKEKNQKKNAVFNSGFQGSSPEIDMVVQIEKESVSGEQHAHEKSIQHIHIIEGKILSCRLMTNTPFSSTGINMWE